jgi:FkbM family methyltransferase
LFYRLNPGDISIRHQYTGDRIRLHSFRHKGYWYHGKNREKETMMLFARLLEQGDRIIEAGGHIGYISLYFRHLVGSSGHVIVFEPGENNLRYLRHNILGKGIELVEKAVGNANGKVAFLLDPLSGQNNSCVAEFGGFRFNKENTFVDPGELRKVEVPIVRLDDFVQERSFLPTLVKIDVEAFEFDVLKGAENLLRNMHPVFMVEVTANEPQIFDLFTQTGYCLFNPELLRLRSANVLAGNIFAFHRDAHRSHAERLGITLA